jgi:tetratricopeptide (TPR) repeat protein
MNELKTYLRDLDFYEAGVDHISLIATYEINKKIYEKRITQAAADSIEHKISYLQVNQLRESSDNKYEIFFYPALYIINFNRTVLGKPPVKYASEKEVFFRDLDQAYYYERNYLFKKAISFYNRVLQVRNLNSTLRTSILLRKGYCYALSGSENKAQENYNRVIKEFGHEGSAVTATVLLRYLEGFSRARKRVLSDNADSLVKSRKLVSLLAYEKALEVLNDASKKASPEDIAQIEYFKARSYRGMGNSEKAVESFLKVITSNPDSVYARYSNRQLYIIGTNLGGSNKIREISKEINLKLKDPLFDQMAEHTDGSLKNMNMEIETVNVVIPEKVAEEVKNIDAKSDDNKEVYVTIITSDGNRFIGRLLKKSGTHISIRTSIGRVDVSREKIVEVLEKK